MLRIGIDLDNTIANYQKVFQLAAREFSQYSDVISSVTKKELKDSVKNNPNDEFLWEKIQGRVYGKYMHTADVYDGFYEFIYVAKNLGHKIYIISHKTKYGHFDNENINLRVEALRWLDQKKILPLVDGVFFKSTRKEKILQIKEMGCEIFIDDLGEVLQDPEFPLDIKKFHFLPNSSAVTLNEPLGLTSCQSWRDLTIGIFGKFSEWPIKKITNSLLNSIEINKVLKVQGRRNSQIFQLIDTHQNKYALKIYPDLMKDPRQRLYSEFNAIKVLTDLGLPVPELIFSCPNLNWSISTWINGVEAAVVDKEFIRQLIEFLVGMQDIKKVLKFDEINFASDAAISCEVICDQTYRKMEGFLKLGHKNLNYFLLKKWVPAFEEYKAQALQSLGDGFGEPIAYEEMVISPSDFGLHNALLQKNGKYIFYDFEYYGFDDPVKLTLDFMLHPAMNLSDDICSMWFECISSIFNVDENFKLRFKSYLPIFSLKWVLIVLNEFHRVGNISSYKEGNSGCDAMGLDRQLRMANRILEAIPEKIKWTIDQSI